MNLACMTKCRHRFLFFWLQTRRVRVGWVAPDHRVGETGWVGLWGLIVFNFKKDIYIVFPYKTVFQQWPAGPVAVLRLRASNGLRAAWQCFACGQAMACGPRGSASPAGKQWPAGRRGSASPAGRQWPAGRVAVLRLRASNGLRAAWQCFACGQAGRRGSILPAGKQRSACWRVVCDRQRFVIPIGNLFSDTTKEPHYFP